MFTGGRKITGGRERCCGCNLDEQEDIKQAFKELLCIRTAAALALVSPNATQRWYRGVQLSWNQQENFPINLHEPWMTLEMSVHVPSSSTSLLGVGVLPQDTNHCMVEWLSLNHSERETAWGESSLSYSMGGRFKCTVFSRTFSEAGAAKCNFKIVQFPLQNGVKNPYQGSRDRLRAE